MKILSWNVNGLRACARKGFSRWLAQCEADIIGLQEVRARPDQLSTSVREPEGWHTHFVVAERAGYSGVGLYSRIPPDHVETSLGFDEYDKEGRVQLAFFDRLLVANVYFPNGSGRNRDNSRVPYKIGFYQRLFEVLESYRQDGFEKIVVMGDFNTAHQEIDLARPKQNQKTSGFLPEERNELQRWLTHGWCDTFRHFEPEGGHYTWWSQRQGARTRNVGWRIDYILVNKPFLSSVLQSFHLPDVMGSDHCPLGLVVDMETERTSHT